MNIFSRCIKRISKCFPLIQKQKKGKICMMPTDDSILFWNEVVLDATKEDFSSANPPEQGGPTRTSRALAIVHLAMYDAYFGILGSSTYLNYAPEAPKTNTLEAAKTAVATAATLTLISLYGRQRASFLSKQQEFLTLLGGTNPTIDFGIEWGNLVATRILADRKNDGSEVSDTLYAPNTGPGRHRPDPVNPNQGFLGPLWGKVKPFGINDLVDKVPGMDPPALDSSKYAEDYNKVLAMGRDQGSTRSSHQTDVGLYWAYDGAFGIGVPPRLYNQVVRAIALQENSSEEVNAKLFAMVNVAMADAGIQTWYEKYKYNVWRPVLGIREADEYWGPSGAGDNNPGTAGDPYWTPLGSPRTNKQNPNDPSAFTPNFPAYPSGHATFGTTALRVVQNVLGLGDDYEFRFVSDELNGKNVGATGIRPRFNPKMTIAQAIEENVLSRVYLGVHWEFDGREGECNGNKIAHLINGRFPSKA
jgi:Vanadium chloroperoxidase N-terminal domain